MDPHPEFRHKNDAEFSGKAIIPFAGGVAA